MINKQKMNNIFKNFLNNSKVIICLTVFLSLPIIGVLLYRIISGDIPLWYDPARDLLSGLAQYQKISLIGPTSGIPGVFYGPYWIWLLSFGQLFSHDPRVVTLVTATFPYLILFPLILFRFSKVLSIFTLSVLWILFLIGFNKYLTNLWNPHPAPTLILLTIYLLFIRNNLVSYKNSIITFLVGFSAGLVMNFHLSFGIGMLLGLLLYFFGESSYYFVVTKEKLKVLLRQLFFFILFLSGVVFAFIPFIIFEIRHNFLQTLTLINAFTQYGAVVSITGLTKLDIIRLFFDSVGSVFTLPFFITGILLVIGIVVKFLSLKNEKQINRRSEFKLFGIIFSIIFGILYLYLTAKNPIWEYHFIGAEILLLLLIGLLIDKWQKVKLLVGVWVFVLCSLAIFNLLISTQHDPRDLSGNLAAEEETVKKIHSESDNQNYVVFAYSPSIYTYEYAYLFQWLYNKDVPFRPELNPIDAELVFLILPPKIDESKKQDFINFRTPPTKYETVQEWIQRDGTHIIKKMKIL